MFDSMKTVIAILLFSKTVLLTQQPVDTGPEWREIQLTSPLTPITPGAKLFVDVSPLTGGHHDYGALKQLFPPGQIEAKLVDSNGVALLLRNGDGVAFGNGTDSLILDADAIRVDAKYIHLFIRSASPLSGIKITWQNYSK
jgi:hypothetical protein